MRVGCHSISIPILFLVLAAGFGPKAAHATSMGKAVPPSRTACTVSAKFIRAHAVDGKIVWTFAKDAPDSISSSFPSRPCPRINGKFDVRIPFGSYSSLAKAIVYPVSTTEPAPGAAVDLRLESVTFVTGETAWLIANDSDSLRVKP